MGDIKKIDLKARNIGLLVGISGVIYFISISRVSDVYLEFVNNHWVAWRERFTPGSQPNEIKVIAEGETFDYAIKKLDNYLKYVLKNRR